MLIEWLNWVRSMRMDELALVLGVLLLVDAPRYALSAIGMAAYDLIRNRFNDQLPGPHYQQYEYLPSVAVVIAGYNEAATIYRTLESVWGRYPHLEIVVVDDGSIDNMSGVANRFAALHSGVRVIRREQRGGKSSALNMGIRMTKAEVIVTVDADSRLTDASLLELVQPLRDPGVGAVSATVIAWNPFVSLATWLQAYEYRHTIFINRMFKGRTGILGIVSGAFGAFRGDLLRKLGGWDVGPGEDGDLALRIRKAGYGISVAPYANCFTNVPTKWGTLFRQRCRWDRTVITFECRKHSDLANPLNRKFHWTNLILLSERWVFNVVCVYTFWLYGVWLLLVYPASAIRLLMLLYCCGFCIEFLQALALLFYSDRPRHDLALCIVLPLYPLYQVYMKAVDVVAVTQEIVWHTSSQDNFVPKRVRDATWQW